jgi:hypothetical protein
MEWSSDKIGDAVVLAFFLILTAASFTYAIWAH